MKNRESIFAPFKVLKHLVQKPVSHPLEEIFDKPREVADNYRGFHVNDWEKCIGCGTCSEICPTEAITIVERAELEDVKGSYPRRPTIDYGKCCFCALCVDVCPSGSLGMSKQYLHISSDPEQFYFMPTDKVFDKDVKMGYTKTESSDLLKLERIQMEQLETDERKDSFIEIVKGFSKEQAIAEAARCVECGICTKTCPAHMNIPEYIRAIWEDNFEDALQQVYKENPLPGVCGRICTHACETACALTRRGEAISIRWLKRYIVDNAPADVYEKVIVEPVTKEVNGKIAIVGAGPSGLAAAYYLKTLGYAVEVFEQMPLAGGVMRYGIPKYRLPDESIDKDINLIERIGVKIHTSAKIGKDVTLEELKEKFDVVFLASGFFEGRNLPIPGNNLEGVKLGLDFLKIARDYGRGAIAMPDVHEKVVVIGGGNVAFDVARTLVRLQNEKYGKSHVSLVALESRDILPADAEEYEEGLEEGIKFFLGNGPQEFVGEDNKLKGLKVWKCLSVFDENKAFNPKFDKEQEQIIEGTQVYVTVGQAPDYSYIPQSIMEQIVVNRGKITVEENGRVKGVDWLFAGGDIMKGPNVITGIATGHNAAIAIDEYLTSKK